MGIKTLGGESYLRQIFYTSKGRRNAQVSVDRKTYKKIN